MHQASVFPDVFHQFFLPLKYLSECLDNRHVDEIFPLIYFTPFLCQNSTGLEKKILKFYSQIFPGSLLYFVTKIVLTYYEKKMF